MQGVLHFQNPLYSVLFCVSIKAFFGLFGLVLVLFAYKTTSSWCKVSNCSAGITNPVAQQGDIASQSVSRFTFVITTTTNLATDSSCTVGLINSLVSPRDYVRCDVSTFGCYCVFWLEQTKDCCSMTIASTALWPHTAFVFYVL